jgi:hypothetical protein
MMRGAVWCGPNVHKRRSAGAWISAAISTKRELPVAIDDATRQRGLLHELWEYPQGVMTLSLFCVAGPRGDEARAALPANAKLIWTAWAESHFEAMSLYHARQGPEPYTTDQAWDLEPYPQGWIDEQRAFLAKRGSA